MRKILIFALFLISATTFSQVELFRGNVNIVGDPRVDSLIQRHIALNKKFPGIEGYRVMIYFESGNNSKDSANKVIERFHEKYPNVPAYLSFNSPYYRVRVGNFRSRMEGERFLNRIKANYPNAWVIQTKIEPPKLEDPVDEKAELKK